MVGKTLKAAPKKDCEEATIEDGDNSQIIIRDISRLIIDYGYKGKFGRKPGAMRWEEIVKDTNLKRKGEIYQINPGKKTYGDLDKYNVFRKLYITELENIIDKVDKKTMKCDKKDFEKYKLALEIMEDSPNVQKFNKRAPKPAPKPAPKKESIDMGQVASLQIQLLRNPKMNLLKNPVFKKMSDLTRSAVIKDMEKNPKNSAEIERKFQAFLKDNTKKPVAKKEAPKTVAKKEEAKWTDKQEKQLQMLEMMNKGPIKVDFDILEDLRKLKKKLTSKN